MSGKTSDERKDWLGYHSCDWTNYPNAPDLTKSGENCEIMT